jgi:hypothetical protein
MSVIMSGTARLDPLLIQEATDQPAIIEQAKSAPAGEAVFTKKCEKCPQNAGN